MVIETLGWLIALAILLLIEIATLNLTTIWFAGGAFAASLAAMAGAPITIQFLIFIVVSVGILFLIRPSVVKYFNKKRIKTNYEGIIGLEAKVIETIDNSAFTGMAMVNGQEWTARAAVNDMIIEAGTKARVVNISGVKLILSKEVNIKEETK